MLNLTKIEFELTTNADMYLFIEEGMTDGVTFLRNIVNPTINI